MQGPKLAEEKMGDVSHSVVLRHLFLCESLPPTSHAIYLAGRQSVTIHFNYLAAHKPDISNQAGLEPFTSLKGHNHLATGTIFTTNSILSQIY